MSHSNRNQISKRDSIFNRWPVIVMVSEFGKGWMLRSQSVPFVLQLFFFREFPRSLIFYNPATGNKTVRQVHNTPLSSSLPPLMATISWFSLLSNTQSHCSWSPHHFKCFSLNVKPLSPTLTTQPTPSHSSKLFKERLPQEAVLGSIVLLTPTHPKPSWSSSPLGHPGLPSSTPH